MFGNKHGIGANATAKKPAIRRETVLVSAKKLNSSPLANDPSSKRASTAPVRRPAPPSSRFQLSQRSSPGIARVAARAPNCANGKPELTTSRTAPATTSRGLKRKAPILQSPRFSSDEESDSSDGSSDLDVSRKRVKSSVSSVESAGLRRNLVLEVAFNERMRADKIEFISGADATSGVFADKYKNPWNSETFATVELQYPSYGPRERFELKWPKDEKDDYKPMEDIIETVKQICSFYFPPELSAKYTSEESGFARLFNRAWVHKNISEFVEVVGRFNEVVEGLVKDGTIKSELSERSQLPLDLVRRILDQTYARTVSPKVESLRAYQNGSDNVYGELLPRFCSEIFTKTKLHHDSVFIDLGSGVGNVVLQAALEKGCESWGIEMMKNPCDLADLQAKEFPQRARLWGIKSGAVNLLRGDFTDDRQIAEVLKRADVVLINNQAFTPALNDKLRDMFLDLKNGCQVVSLKPFVPEGHKMSARNIGSVINTLIQQRFEYFSDSVSWTDQSGYYYIAVKDPRPYQRFVESMQGL